MTVHIDYSTLRCVASFSLIIFASLCARADVPSVESNTTTIADSSFRGLAVRNKDEAWVGGSNGTLMATRDGGKSWTAVKIPGTEELEFRDIELPAPGVVVVMAAGPGEKSKIFRSQDAGKTWILTLHNKKPQGFFNAIAFWSAEDGLLVGDPLEGRIELYRTVDGGATWKQLPEAARPRMQDGEYGFAASGTNLSVTGNSDAYIATGGSQARLLISSDMGRTWTAKQTPIVSGKDSTGIFSVAFRDAQHGLIVGGDYKEPEMDNGNIAGTTDGGVTWQLVRQTKPIPHKACIRHLKGTEWMAVGRTGIVYSKDDGRSWTMLSDQSYYTFDVGPDGAGWLAGAEGRVARFLAE
jgi:photosystem II stability/assembly factor-like uncharacterized protein